MYVHALWFVPAHHAMPSVKTSEDDAEPELSKVLLRSSDGLGGSDSGPRSAPSHVRVYRSYMKPPRWAAGERTCPTRAHEAFGIQRPHKAASSWNFPQIFAWGVQSFPFP